jgi:cytochrome P450 family 135
MRTVFGVSDDERLGRLRAALKELLEWTTARRRLFLMAAVGPRRLTESSAIGFMRARSAVDELVFEEIRRREADPALADRDDVLSMLLQARDEDGEPMTDRELRDELVTLLVAGHETTASALSWGFEQLVRAPATLARVTDAAVADDTAYLEATVKEILRRRPVLPIAQPRRIKQEVEIGGRTYAPGPAFTACIYLVHHDARIYPEPYAFRPERFLDGGNPGKFSWIPFGGGVRRCLGASFAQLEMRIALRAILSQVEVASAIEGREGIGRRSITLSPRRGTPISVRPRVREPQVAIRA